MSVLHTMRMAMYLRNDLSARAPRIFTLRATVKRMASMRIACVALVCCTAAAYAAPPRIFYTDLTSGPNTGGENNNGAYVTLYGKGFGASRGSSYVSIGSGKAVAYKIWTDTKIAIQLGAAASSGNITVTNAQGASNGAPFTVRAGKIYFVSTSGSDANNGSFASPWKTIVKAKDSIAAGDIAYIMDGVSQTAIDNYSAALSIGSGGTSASLPKAIVAYPGASVTIGSNSFEYALRTPAISGAKNYWVIAGMYLISGGAATDLVSVSGWRFIGNELTCPHGSGQSACFHTDTTTNLAFYGNYVHNVGDAAGTIDKYYHAVYFTTNSNHIDAGWNTVVPNPNGSKTSGGCRAMQFYSTGGADQFDLHVHDNLIHDAICDGINFATVNPDNGTVEAYNNIVYHVGTGPDPDDGSSNYACVLTGSSSSPSAKVEIYNNTFYDCGSRGTTDSGTVTPYIAARLRNNLSYQLSGEMYVGGTSGSKLLSGSNNVWYGVGNTPGSTTANITSNPLLVNAGARDLHLQSSSPAVNAGVAISSLATDFDGIVRPQGTSFDVGAYEYGQGSGSGKSACDLNADGNVDSVDVQSAISQAIGTTACSNADLVGNGVCSVVDVQRVANAASGQSCRVGR